MRYGSSLLSLLLVAIPAWASAQVGLVYDAESGAPLPTASVTWQPDDGESVGHRVDADLRGRFRVPDAWTGDGAFQVSAFGHVSRTLTKAEAEAASWRIALTSDPLQLQSVVVTASGRAQRRAEIPVPISRITAAEIEATGATSAESLLDEIPGLQATPSAPVGSNVMIRGIGDSRVLVLLDGQPAGGALLENRDLSRMSLAGVERVEVVKGPLSSRYGSDALGGVINVITRDPDPGLRLDARAMAGGTGRRDADVTVSGGGDLRYRVTGSWRQEDEVPGLDDSLDVFSRVWDLRSTARYQTDGRFRARSDFTVVRERQRWPVGGGFSGFNDNRGLTGWAELGVRTGPGEATVRVFGQDYYHLYRSARGDAPIAGADQEKQVEQLWKGTLAYAAELGPHEVDFGVEGSYRQIESPDKLLQDQASDQQLELFGQEAWTVGPATLTGGARLTLNDRWGDALSPSVGANLLLREDLMLRATVGRGFRAPSFKELAWDFANVGAGYTVQGYADLDPEQSWSFSAGADWAPTSSLSLGLEAYDNEIENLVETQFIGYNPGGLQIYSPRNVSRARTRGFELTAQARLGRAQVDADYAFLDARSVDTDTPLDRRAKHSGRMRLTTDLGLLDGLRVDLTGHLTGDAPLIGLDGTGQPVEIGTQERRISMDAQLTLQVPGDLRLIAGVDNLFNSRPEGWQAVVERRFRVGLEARDLL